MDALKGRMLNKWMKETNGKEYMYWWMVGWMDGWISGWVNGWINKWMGEWMKK